ncbi:TonB-dependent receptor [Ectopseudomonas khazarica]|uniref:TonB-dependent receptor n=4 Tax=Gammaproteobacteria TaxID=1236 RepID=A0ABW7MGF5_9GAMM
MSKSFSRASSAVLLCTCSPMLWAEQAVTLPDTEVRAAAAPASALSLDVTAESASRLGLTPRETPASVSVVTREQIERRGAENTQQMLMGVPGVVAAAPPGFAGAVSWRGFTGSQVTQMFNGITVQYDAIAARPVDGWIYERVEAVGGASGFLNGAGAVGGSLNYVTKLASRDDAFSEGRIRYGSFDSNELAYGFNQPLGDYNHVRLDVSRSASNGYVDREQREAWTSAFSLLTDFTEQLSHTLALEYQEEKVDSPYWGSPVLKGRTGDLKVDESRRFENYNVEDGRYEQRVRWLRSMTEYRFSDATRVLNTLYHYNARREYRNLETYAYTDASNSQVQRSNALLQRHDQELNGNRLELRHQHGLFGLSSEWAVGVDYSHNVQTRYPRSVSGPFGVVDAEHFTPGNFFDLPGMSPGYARQRTNQVDTWALFVENRLQLTERLSLLTGLRHDRIDLEVTNHQAATASNPAFFSREYEPTTGRVGLIYALTPAANVYVQYSTAADPPAGILTTASLSQVQDFDLTKGRQLEVGSKFDFLAGRGSATLAAYRIERENLATRDPANPGQTLAVGKQSTLGLEIAAALRVTPRLLAEANLAWLDAQYDAFNENVAGQSVSRKGNTPTNVPDQVANLWLTYDLAPRWQVGVDSRYVASVYADAANQLKAPAYTLFGAFVSYRVDADSRLTLRARNLTDEVYASWASSDMLFLGAPRSFELALQSRF